MRKTEEELKRRNIILDHEKDILVSLELVKLKDDITLPIDINKIHTYSSINKNECNTSISSPSSNLRRK